MSTANSEETELCRCVLAAANAFRVGFSGLGNSQLTRAIELLGKELEVGSIQKRLKLQVGLNNIFEAQKRHDYIGIADLLEYEVGPVVGVAAPD